MTTLQEAAMRKALDVITRQLGIVGPTAKGMQEAEDALRTALAQQGEQPVAYLVYDKGASSQYVCFDDELGDTDGLEVTPLYTAAPAPQPAQYKQGALHNIAENLRDAWFRHTGAEPSESALGMAIEKAADMLDLQSAQPVAQQDHIPEAGKMAQTVAHPEGGKQGGKQQLPPLQPVAPLTDSQLTGLYSRHAKYQEEGMEVSGLFDFARAIEAAHGIKGVK